MNKLVIVLTCLYILLSAPTLSSPRYRVVDLGLANNFTIRDVNESGQVCGTQYINGVAHAVVINADGNRADLGTFGRQESYALGLNDQGQVVGYSINWQQISPTQRYGEPVPFMWDPVRGGGDYPCPNQVGQLCDISDTGLIAAGLRSPSGYSHAYYYDSGSTTPHDLGTFGATYSRASLVNERGDVAGEYGAGTHTFFWRPGVGMVGVGDPAEGYIISNGMNNAGQIVGDLDSPDGRYTAFCWDPVEGMTHIDVAGKNAEAYDINDLGQVVGAASFTPNWDYRSYLWEKGKGAVDLQTVIDDPTWNLYNGA